MGQLAGQDTNFVAKIWERMQHLVTEQQFEDFFPQVVGRGLFPASKYTPKIHTIRHDDKNRWKEGMMIDFFINSRTKDMFRFAPRLPVVSTQEIRIIHDNNIWVYIDGTAIGHSGMKYDHPAFLKLTELAHNDGFSSVIDFFLWFDEDFTGKIIHWTDKRY